MKTTFQILFALLIVTSLVGGAVAMHQDTDRDTERAVRTAAYFGYYQGYIDGLHTNAPNTLQVSNLINQAICGASQLDYHAAGKLAYENYLWLRNTNTP